MGIETGFGRKGAAQKGSGGDPLAGDLAAQREAFIASERSRKTRTARPASFNPADTKGPRANAFDHLRSDAGSPLSPASRRKPRAYSLFSKIFGAPHERRAIVAYILWFFTGQVSMHRFYCGDKKGALGQIFTLVLGLMAGAVLPPAGLFVLVIWALWIFGDLLLIPGLLRRFQREHSDANSAVFA